MDSAARSKPKSAVTRMAACLVRWSNLGPAPTGEQITEARLMLGAFALGLLVSGLM